MRIANSPSARVERHRPASLHTTPDPRSSVYFFRFRSINKTFSDLFDRVCDGGLVNDRWQQSNCDRRFRVGVETSSIYSALECLSCLASQWMQPLYSQRGH